MILRPLVNASAILETADCRLGMDLWINEPIMLGAWWHWPPQREPMNQRIPELDIIAVTHQHADHLDVEWLQWYQRAVPSVKIVIADRQSNSLSAILTRAGIAHECGEKFTKGDTTIHMLPVRDNPRDIDTAIVVTDDKHSLVNYNDCLPSEDLFSRIRAIEPNPIVGLIPYAGAGSYPQTFYPPGDELTRIAAWKKQLGLDRFQHIVERMNPAAAIPFAGSYVLGGKLWNLNQWRGMADATEASSLVLADGASFDVTTGQASAERKVAYTDQEILDYAVRLSPRALEYEWHECGNAFQDEFAQACINARRKSQATTDHWFVFYLGNDPTGYIVNVNPANELEWHKDPNFEIAPWSEIYIDHRLFHGLITGKWHWGDAEGGSLYFTRRKPDIFDRATNDFLLGLHV